MTETKRILVVEDETMVSEVIAAALADRYAVTVVETATEAKGKLANGGFRLMLLDCTLPGGSDHGLIPAAERVGTVVVLVSGDPGRMARLTDQPRPFVLKPFSLAGLLEVVEAAVSSDVLRPGEPGFAA